MNTDDITLDASLKWAHHTGDRYYLDSWYENEARNFASFKSGTLRYIYELSRVVYWRCKSRIAYPLRYRTNKTSKFVKRKFLDPIRRAFKKKPVNEDIELRDMRTYPGATEYGYLPRDVWLTVLLYVGESERYKMLQLNREWLELLAPSAYEKIHCSLVISSTEKLKKNDLCYLSAGPDSSYESTSNAYEIYLRSRAARPFDYEILDIESRKLSKQGDDITLVTAHESISLLLDNVMRNPKSKMRQYIEEFFIDTIFLDGLDWVGITNDNLEKPIRDIVSKDIHTNSSYSNKGQITAPRYCGEYEWSNRVRRRAMGIYDDQFLYHIGDNQYGKVYPNDVYRQELEIVQRSLKNVFNGRRQRIFNGDLDQKFESGCLYYQRFEENSYNTDPQRVLSSNFIEELQTSIDNLSITKRNFYTKDQIDTLIENILDIYSVKNKSNSIRVCSALFTGMESSSVGYYDPQLMLYNPGQIILNRILD